MRNKFYRVCKIIVSSLMILIVFFGLRFLFVPVMYGHWAEHDKKKNRDCIDVVILGDSFAVNSIQPSEINEIYNCVSYNAGTSAQTNDMMFYTLKDLHKSIKIKKAILCLDCYNFKPSDVASNFSSYVIAMERINNPLIKIECLLNTVGEKNIIDFIMPDFYFNERNLKEIPSNVKVKTSRDYRNYAIDKTKETYYLDMGYVYTSISSPDSDSATRIDLNTLSVDEINWLTKTLDYCFENNIEVILLQTPFKRSAFSKIKGYENYNNKIKDIATEYGVDFYDFNRYVEYGEIQDEMYKDETHVNYEGSCILMKWIKRAVSSDDPKSLFD